MWWVVDIGFFGGAAFTGCCLGLIDGLVIEVGFGMVLDSFAVIGLVFGGE